MNHLIRKKTGRGPNSNTYIYQLGSSNIETGKGKAQGKGKGKGKGQGIALAPEHIQLFNDNWTGVKWSAEISKANKAKELKENNATIDEINECLNPSTKKDTTEKTNENCVGILQYPCNDKLKKRSHSCDTIEKDRTNCERENNEGKCAIYTSRGKQLRKMEEDYQQKIAQAKKTLDNEYKTHGRNSPEYKQAQTMIEKLEKELDEWKQGEMAHESGFIRDNRFDINLKKKYDSKNESCIKEKPEQALDRLNKDGKLTTIDKTNIDMSLVSSLTPEERKQYKYFKLRKMCLEGDFKDEITEEQKQMNKSNQLNNLKEPNEIIQFLENKNKIMKQQGLSPQQQQQQIQQLEAKLTKNQKSFTDDLMQQISNRKVDGGKRKSIKK